MKFKRMKYLSARKEKSRAAIVSSHDEEAFEEITLPCDVRINLMLAEMGIPWMVPLNLPELNFSRSIPSRG